MALPFGPAQPVQEVPETWAMVTAISLGKHKQGEFWIEGSGQTSCPQIGCVERIDKLKADLLPVLNQFVELKPDQKYAIMHAKGVRTVVFYVLTKSEHIASYQHQILTKNEFPVPAFAYPVRKRLLKTGPDPSLLENPERKILNELGANTMDEPTGPPQRPAHVWEEHERNGHLPKLPDCLVCVKEQSMIVKHAPNATPRLHTLSLYTGY